MNILTKRHKKMIEKLDRLVEEAGLAEEFSRLSDSLSQKYMIQGEETEDLREALRRAPDELLSMIWDEIVDREKTGEADRGRKEELLYEDIQEHLRMHMTIMDPVKLRLLINVMSNYPISTLEAATVLGEFVPRGWVFAFLEDGSCTYVVMKELQDILITLEEDKVKEEMSLAIMVRFIVKACLALYGVFRMDQFRDFYKKYMVADGMTEEEVSAAKHLDGLFRSLIPIFERENMLWQDAEYIVSPYFQTRKEYRELLRKQKGEYFIPMDESLLKGYFMEDPVVRDEEYKTVLRLLGRELRDRHAAEEMLKEIADGVTKEDWEIPQVMECLYEWDVAFDSPKTASKLVAALSEWMYGIRRWSECGFSRRELGKANKDLKYLSQSVRTKPEREAAQKIYPNDPCPCGSGKMYKKCCGRQ